MKLDQLRRLRKLDKLSDEDMVNFQRINLLDAAAPNPSVETLLHAFLPHKFVDPHAFLGGGRDHRPDRRRSARARDLRRHDGLCAVSHPGFTLSKWVADAYEKNPKVQGIILLRHGIFTFGEDARAAYELMIEMVTRAEDRLARGKKAIVQAKLPKPIVRMADDRADPARRLRARNDRRAGTAKRQISSVSAPARKFWLT